MYSPIRSPRSVFVPIRGLRHHLLEWGSPAPGQRPLVLLHGWMDVAASWQFMVDALARERWILAPDWRGFGLTEVPPDTDTFWFPDYLADLDALLDHLHPDGAIDLVGHSMGGNLAMMYAGIRPRRIARLANLEGFGLPASRPSQAPGRYARWLDDLKALRAGQAGLSDYEDAGGVARRLMKTNPRLAPDKAAWLARQWARPGADGRWRILGHPAHKLAGAHLYRADEVVELNRRITAPVLMVQAREDTLGGFWKTQYTRQEFEQRLAAVPRVRRLEVPDAGHMLHHDQPALLARTVEDFFSETA